MEHIDVTTNVKLNYEAITKRLRIVEEEDALLIKNMCNEASAIAKPKSIYKELWVEDITHNSVTIGNVTFKSPLLSNNLKNINRVFFYVSTCGKEVLEWAKKIEDPIERCWADYIMENILLIGHQKLRKTIIKKYGTDKITSMNPGSLRGWSIDNQEGLFKLFDDVEGGIGVELKESCLMIPEKSLSGVFFPTETDYVNCKLCNREICKNRRSEYDKELEIELMKEEG